MSRLKYLSFVFILLSACQSNNEEIKKPPEQAFGLAPSDELFQTIATMDSLYFAAQNACDLEQYASYLAEDFEFFHDKGGFTNSKESEMADMAIFCGEEQRNRQPLRREIIKESLRVFPMDNYGALQFCDHVFHLQFKDGTEKVVGSGKMTALWKQENSKDWKLARVISYDHQPLAELELPDEILEQYVGNYSLPDRIVNIKKEGKLLRVSDVNDGQAGWTKELFPESETIFYLNYENTQFEFVKEGTKVTQLNIYGNGKLLEQAKRK